MEETKPKVEPKESRTRKAEPKPLYSLKVEGEWLDVFEGDVLSPTNLETDNIKIQKDSDTFNSLTGLLRKTALQTQYLKTHPICHLTQNSHVTAFYIATLSQIKSYLN